MSVQTSEALNLFITFHLWDGSYLIYTCKVYEKTLMEWDIFSKAADQVLQVY